MDRLGISVAAELPAYGIKLPSVSIRLLWAVVMTGTGVLLGWKSVDLVWLFIGIAVVVGLSGNWTR